jgi:hypothetical protein
LKLVVANGLSTPGTLPTSVSGCGITSWTPGTGGNAQWNFAIATAPFNDVAVFYAMNVPGGSCTVTASFGSSTGINIMIDEYSGETTTYAVEVSTTFGRQNCCFATSITTQGTDDLIFAVENFGPGSGSCSSINNTSIGTVFTFRANTCSSSPSGFVSGTFDVTGGPGTYTFDTSAGGIVNTFGSNITITFIAFRSVLPSPGRLQYSGFSATNAVTFPLPNGSGHALIVMCENDTGLPSDSDSQSWMPLPIEITSDSSNSYHFYGLANSASYSGTGGGTTVTCSTSSSTKGSQVWEYSGLSSTAPFGASSVYFTQNTGIGTIPAGTVQANSTSVLFSMGAVMQNTGITFSASGSLVPVSAGGNGDSLQMWDEVVSSGSYSNTITPSSASFFPQGLIMVLESAPVATPVLKQRTRGSAGSGSDSSLSATLIGAVKQGDLIVVPMTNQTVSTGPGAMSDSIGDTWHTYFAPGTGNGYGLFWTIAGSNVAAGSYTATNTNAQCVALLDFGVPSAPAQDVFSTAANLSGASSLGTGSITTGFPNELVLSFSTVDDASNRLGFTSQSTGWSGLGLTCGGHDAALFAGWQPQVATGTYSNTFTWDTSMPITASIASFKFTGSGSQPSSGTFIGYRNPPAFPLYSVDQADR